LSFDVGQNPESKRRFSFIFHFTMLCNAFANLSVSSEFNRLEENTSLYDAAQRSPFSWRASLRVSERLAKEPAKEPAKVLKSLLKNLLSKGLFSNVVMFCTAAHPSVASTDELGRPRSGPWRY
jgi:hypothetical protein